MTFFRAGISNKNMVISILILTYLLIYLLCKFDMFAQDEYNYSNVAGTSERVKSIGDIVNTQKILYEQWSGRIPALAGIQLFLLVGTPIYNIINSVVFIVSLLSICKVINKKISFLQISSILFLILYAINVFWEKFIWISGSLNYLWTITAMLIVMKYIYKIIIKEEEIKLLDKILLFILSFFAGWSHENTAFILGSFLFVIIGVNWKKILKLDNKKKQIIIFSTLLFIFGSILLIFAPGNFYRLGTSDTSLTIKYILRNLYKIKYLILIYILITIVAFIYGKRKDKILNQVLYFIFPCIIALIPMVIIHDFPQRAMLAYEICFMICIADSILILEQRFQKYNMYIKVFTVIISLLAISNLLYKAWFAYKYVNPYKISMEKEINYAKANSKNDVILTKFDKYDEAKKIGMYMDPFPKTLDISIINTYMAKYYGVNSIIALDKNTSMIEIILNDEEILTNYNLVDKNTYQVVSMRMSNTELQMPNLTMSKRIVYVIPTSLINDVIVDFPNRIINNINKVYIKDLNDVFEVNIDKFIK